MEVLKTVLIYHLLRLLIKRQDVLKTKKSLKNFLSNQVNQEDDVVFSCGSGVAACVVGSAYKSLSKEDNFNVFDGSWTEWALRNNLKIK